MLVREGFGIELHRGRFEVNLDGQPTGSLQYGQTLEIPLEPGHHSLRITKGRYSSRDHPFDAGDEETVNFRCHGAMVWTRFVASLVKPDFAISLRKE